MKKNWKKTLITAFLITAVLAGCSSNNNNNNNSTNSANTNTNGNTSAPTETAEKPFHISIMTMAYSPEPPADGSPVIKALEEFTNTDLDVEFVPASNFAERFNITLASNELPTLLLAEKSSSFIDAAKKGAFWDLTDKLKDYENLSQLNEIVKNNISIDGKIYGIPRLSADLGNSAVTIRQDWLDNLGLSIPKTIDEFYNVMDAFTNDDPDQNGKKDTYGMVVSEYPLPWDVMQIWYGVPNEWGIDDSGKLYPYFQDDRYLEALNFFKKMYDEGLVNEDFAVMDSGKWGDAFVNGQAGSMIDTPGRSTRSEKTMVQANPELEGSVGLFGAVEGPEGLFNRPSIGYDRMFAIPKSTVKTEEDLDKVLAFVDKLATEEGQKLAFNGIEGVHYEIKDGEYVPFEDDQKLVYEHTDTNQLLTFIAGKNFYQVLSDNKKREKEVVEANNKIVVPNPAEPLISGTYTRIGQQLDNIMLDARIQYIVGQIDEKGLKDAEALWLKTGGDKYIEEINQEYQKYNK
ncbi:extracellular solute-binding protein [Paenibacillus sp. HB172176]|uniref:extracellular solute-binding protein n=1 Tax=Paenibacillus sp. HB172176 TaxID=2493690 RepID=UPI00143AF0CA|nr:extracellular solute-binding protein [Paenibacillus sp. HB172176]